MDNYELDDVEVKPLMAQIQEQVVRLGQLKDAVEEAEEVLKQAQIAYDRFVKEEFTTVFRMNGLETLEMEDGRRIRVVQKTQCSINKNDADKQNVAEWLRKHNGDTLVKSELHVPQSQLDKCKEAGIIYEETMSMNTNAVKAFVLDQLGQKGSPALITVEDLPKGLNFYQYDDVEITR